MYWTDRLIVELEEARVLSMLRTLMVFDCCVNEENASNKTVASAPIETRCLKLSATHFMLNGCRTYSLVRKRSRKLPFGPRDASSNLSRSDAERFPRSQSHFSCPIQDETANRNADCATCESVATTAARRMSSVHSSSERPSYRTRSPMMQPRAPEPSNHVPHSHFHSRRSVHSDRD